MEEQKRLGSFKKYVPFLDHVIKSNTKYSSKFAEMRRWIVSNKKISVECYKKMERSIIVTYEDISKAGDFPEKLKSIFTINLCSEDEENPNKKHQNQESLTISDDDKVSEIHVTRKKSTDSKHSQLKKDAVDTNKNIFERINATNDLLCKNNKKNGDGSSDLEDFKIYQRCDDFISENVTKRKKNKKKKKHKRKKHRSHHYLKEDCTILLDSSSDDESQIVAKTKNSQEAVKDKNYFDSTESKIITADVLKNVDIDKLRTIRETILRQVHIDKNILTLNSTTDEMQSLQDKQLNAPQSIPVIESGNIMNYNQKTYSQPIPVVVSNNITHNNIGTTSPKAMLLARSSTTVTPEAIPIVQSGRITNYNPTIVPNTILSTQSTTLPTIPSWEIPAFQNINVNNSTHADVPQIIPSAQSTILSKNIASQANLQNDTNSNSLLSPPLISSIQNSSYSQSAFYNSNFNLPSSNLTRLHGRDSVTHMHQQYSTSNYKCIQPMAIVSPNISTVQPPYANIPSMPLNSIYPPISPTEPCQATQNIYNNNPTTVKDPRLRKLLSEGQYGYHRRVTTTPPTTTSTTLSSQKSNNSKPVTYGEYIKEKKRIEEEKKRIEEESIRQAEEWKQIAKEQEELKKEKQAKSSNQILNNDNSKSSEKEISTASKVTSTIPSSKTSKKNSSTSKQSNDRVLKELECTIIGYRSFQDFIPKTIEGKRRSSMCARKAIAEQLAIYEESTSKKRRKSESGTINYSLFELEDENHKRRKIEKEIVTTKPCYVKLKRLSKKEVLKYTQNPKESDTVNNNEIETKSTVKSNESEENNHSVLKALLEITNETRKEKNYAHKTTTAKVRSLISNKKNINGDMTEKTCTICTLCDRRYQNLTSHFIHYHKSESYISRLTWEELSDLQLQVPFAEEVTTSDSRNVNRPQRYKINCPFCPKDNNEIEDTFCNLRRHYSTHTGEYSYRCKGCGVQKGFKKQIQMHQQRSKCKDTSIQTVYVYPTDLMVIYMYVCHICNFVQLNKENVCKHLREQHFKQPHIVSKLVKEYPLAAIKDGPIERVCLSTLPEILPAVDEISDIDIPLSNENIFVGNEPLLDDSFGNNIKTESNANENQFVCQTLTPLNLPDGIFTVVHAQNNNNEDTLDIKTEIDTEENNYMNFTKNEEVEKTLEFPQSIPLLPVIEEKPNPENLAIESAKALLLKITSKTGIRQDLLYQCPNYNCGGYFSNFHMWSIHMTKRHNSILSICPYCRPKGNNPIDIEIPIADFDEHFNSHCLHSYLCFHCDFTCTKESKLREHAVELHPEISELHIERIPFNITYSYYVIIGKEVFNERLDFLMELTSILRTRLQRLEAEEDYIENTSIWPVKENASWMDDAKIPIFKMNVTDNFCFLSNCRKPFDNPTDLLNHLQEQHNDFIKRQLQCMVCNYNSGSSDWDGLVRHNYLHSKNVYICCCCLYLTYDRRLLSQHIRLKHDKRDVGVISLFRSAIGTKAEIAFVFSAGAKTFNTSNICFCGCGMKNLSIDKYVFHLRREHLLKLRYFCEYCDERLPQLQSCDEHFRIQHGNFDTPLKVRCQIACNKDRLLDIVSANPLQIQLSDENHLQIESRTTIEIPQNSIVKNEILVDEEEAILMEEDEVVAETEAVKFLSTFQENPPSIGLNCANILKLL